MITKQYCLTLTEGELDDLYQMMGVLQDTKAWHHNFRALAERIVVGIEDSRDREKANAER